VERILDGATGHVLPYDERAAHAYAELREERRLEGRGLGIDLLNPWDLGTDHQSR
jgi:hypothetical protein